jgi:hypothetical protein
VGDLVGGQRVHNHKGEELGARSNVAEHFVMEHEIGSHKKAEGLDVDHGRLGRGINKTGFGVGVH